MKNILILIAMGCLLAACGTKENKFSDPILIKIADLQDRRSSDSLFQYFKHKNAAYRKDAVLAFASIQDTLAINTLGDVLKYDKDAEVRKAAATALGQLAVPASAAVLWKTLSTEKDEKVLREIIESCGKVFEQKDVHQLVVPVSTPLINEGLAWAYYRLGLRGKADSTLLLKAKDFLKPDQGLQTRIAAAHFYMRSPRVALVEKELVAAAQKDESPYVRSACTVTLRKIKTPASRDVITKILETDTDYRVRISAARALQDFAWPDVKPALLKALKDSNINVAIQASEAIRSNLKADEENELATLARGTSNWRVKANLYEAALIDSNSVAIVDEIVQHYKTETNPYAKAALLIALSQSTQPSEFVYQELLQSKIPVIKSSAATALTYINANIYFDKSQRGEFLKMYIKAIEDGDPAVIGIVAGALMEESFGYKELVKDYTFLYDAQKKLSLPKDNEALQPLEAAIAFFEGKSKPVVKNEFNHPINWELVKTIAKNQKVLVKTSKGDIVLKLLVEEAPGSVANFVDLINKKYFDSKNFHRVVPNFVIQGGCNRGDGSGSEDYSIRSEFTEMHYTEGSVGMASAGKDTEGTQWFITHSPTPHLDGRYSIFAVTESGMDVVHKIEVGDMIISVTLVQ